MSSYEKFVIENEKQTLRIFKYRNGYSIVIEGTIFTNDPQRPGFQLAQQSSVSYTIKEGDIRELMHALIDLAKL